MDINNLRATVSVPVSFANLQIDEYAEEQARAEAAAIASGSQAYADATGLVFSGYYAASAGAMYGAAGVIAQASPGHAYLSADAQWFGEKPNCVNGNWQTCMFAENNGHYINLSNTQSVWIGLGESSTQAVAFPFWVYAALIPINVGSLGPA